MIKSFKHKGLELFFTTGSLKSIQAEHEKRLNLRLQALHTSIDIEYMNIKQHNPIHPGQFIKEVYLEPFKITNAELALKLSVNTSTVSRMLRGHTDVAPLMALKLSKVIGRSPASWLLMQDNFNLHKLEQTADLSVCEQIEFAV